MLGLALLAALGMRVLGRGDERARDASASWRSRPLMLEYLNAPLPLADAPPRANAGGAVAEARAASPARSCICRSTIDIENTPFMVQSLEHGRPIVNGYSGQRPAFLLRAWSTRSPTCRRRTRFATLKELDVRFVVSPTADRRRRQSAARRSSSARGSTDGIIYELRWTPAAEAALERRQRAAATAAGRGAVSPRAKSPTYDVHWDGGPLNLPAGRAILTRARRRAGRRSLGVRSHAPKQRTGCRASSRRAIDSSRTADRLLPADRTRARDPRGPPRSSIAPTSSTARRVSSAWADSRATRAAPTPWRCRSARRRPRCAHGALSTSARCRCTPGAIVTRADQRSRRQSRAAGRRGRARDASSSAASTHRAIRLEPRLMRRIERRRPITHDDLAERRRPAASRCA